jgi:putative PIN family toxin of toxin-antitoxin system
MPAVVVFDTNVLLSGIGWRGKPFECLEMARSGAIHGVTCREIIDELAEKLTAKLKLSDDVAIDVIADLMTFLELTSITRTLRVVADDPEDDKVLECAVAARADFVVTGDKRHLLPIRVYAGVEIVSPAELIRRIGAAS